MKHELFNNILNATSELISKYNIEIISSEQQKENGTLAMYVPDANITVLIYGNALYVRAFIDKNTRAGHHNSDKKVPFDKPKYIGYTYFGDSEALCIKKIEDLNDKLIWVDQYIAKAIKHGKYLNKN